MIGARLGQMTPLRRLLGRATAGTFAAWVVPDARLARAAGLDLAAAGVDIAATPRHASVMLIVGDLPQGLAEAATIVYAQMPRPRAILALGIELPPPLPPADVIAAADQAGLVEGVARLRMRIAAGAWSLDVEPFTASVLAGAAVDADGGMDHSMMGHGSMDHSQMDHGAMDHAAMGHGPPGGAATGERAGADTAPDEQAHIHHGTMDHGAMHHAAMGKGAMDHGALASGEQVPAPPLGTDHSGHDVAEHGDHAHMHHEGGAAPQDEAEPGHAEHAAAMSNDQTQASDPVTTPPTAPPAPSDHGAMGHGAMHPHHHAGMGRGVPESQDEPDEADHAEMDHAAMGHVRDAGADHGVMGHGDVDDAAPDDHSKMDHGAMEHSQMKRGAMHHALMGQRAPERADDGAGAETAPDEHSRMHHDGMDHSQMDHGSMDHSAMGHGGMDHSAMSHDHHMTEGGFMSMVAMTQGLPRSTDGLPMEWIDTSFGPLFPGLPAGLAPTLTLDGDTVAGVSLASGVVHRGIAATLPGPAGSFADRLARLDPLAPIAYRALAQQALAAISGEPLDTAASAWVGACERERAASHMGWLAAFAELLGIGWLANRAAELHLAVVHAAEVATVAALRGRIARTVEDVHRLPMLERRLAGIGVLPPDAVAMSGPVARGSGLVVDARMGDSRYRAHRFEPIVREGGGALARLQVRLAEIVQSLDLIIASGTLEQPATRLPNPHLSGTGMATVETPRGAAVLHLGVQHGQVTMAHVMPPSATHKALLTAATDQAELADALVAIASLDLSPWEIDQ